MAGDQLELSLTTDPGGGPDDLAAAGLPARIAPMTPAEGERPFDDDDYFFEPWWPGSRATATVIDGSPVRVRAEHMADPLASFPELAAIGEQLSLRRAIVEGTLLVLDEAGRPDHDLLRQRLADPSPTGRGSGAFVACDLLHDGSPLVGRPFAERRALLAGALRDGELCVLSRGLVGEGVTMARALESLGIEALSARRLDAAYRRGPAGDAWLRIPLVPPPSVERRPLLALLQRLPL